MRVLVTGGCGFIGSHVVDRLVALQDEVVVLDDLSSGQNYQNPEAEYVVCDITEGPYQIGFEPEAVVHLAAQPSLFRSMQEPELDARVNILGTLKMLSVASEYGASFVLASTSAVYEPNSYNPKPVFQARSPKTPYGVAKSAAEMYTEISGLEKWFILRFGNVYGPRQVPVGENQLIPRVLDHIYRGKPLVIHGDGTHSRDFVYVEDVAEMVCRAAHGRANQSGCYNVGTGHDTSVNEVLDLINLATLHDTVYHYGPEVAGESRRVSLDSDATIRAFGWRPKYELTRGLASTIRWYCSQLESE